MDHLFGLLTGLATFIIIGLFHPVVIKCHYHFGVGCRWWFVVLAIIAGVASYYVDNQLLSTVLGVVAFSSLWTVKEIADQEKRVERGWFPPNPRRQQKKSQADAQRLSGDA